MRKQRKRNSTPRTEFKRQSKHAFVPVPHFTAALLAQPEAMDGWPSSSKWRYTHGDLPNVMYWLLDHPVLLRALADDAEAQQQESGSDAGHIY